MLKNLVVLTVILSSSVVFAETVKCSNENGYGVSLDLSNEVATDIIFTLNDEVLMKFPRAEVSSYRLGFPFVDNKIRVYEVMLGGARYLDIDRPVHGKTLSKNATGEFMLKKHPFGIAKSVNCTFE